MCTIQTTKTKFIVAMNYDCKLKKIYFTLIIPEFLKELLYSKVPLNNNIINIKCDKIYRDLLILVE